MTFRDRLGRGSPGFPILVLMFLASSPTGLMRCSGVYRTDTVWRITKTIGVSPQSFLWSSIHVLYVHHIRVQEVC
ncbi:hypothetical protein L873DRAFT_1818728 [Choiromyces venosus 120613-1]|uniref:Secreted protein n=1 Tax=Choiromyces venosus 120613-1 TaxID=1336337 RepID=A0A3N4J115_9PEZI|nr:hypothetical protein L873DRAFT_1818728 [Choiromyces venosus 120613-1]